MSVNITSATPNSDGSISVAFGASAPGFGDSFVAGSGALWYGSSAGGEGASVAASGSDATGLGGTIPASANGGSVFFYAQVQWSGSGTDKSVEQSVVAVATGGGGTSGGSGPGGSGSGGKGGDCGDGGKGGDGGKDGDNKGGNDGHGH